MEPSLGSSAFPYLLHQLTERHVCFQGDRGFDGLPGLPGEKGHRVSLRRDAPSVTGEPAGVTDVIKASAWHQNEGANPVFTADLRQTGSSKATSSHLVHASDLCTRTSH